MGRAVGTLAAGQEREYSVRGNYLFVVASSQLLEIELMKRSSSLETHYVKQNGGLHKKNFDSISVRNSGSVETEIEIVTGEGEFSPSVSDAVVSIDTSRSSVPVSLDAGQLNLQVNQQTTGAVNNGLARVTLLQGETKKLCNVNGLRKYLKYNILSSSDCEYVTVGGSVVDAVSGYAMERGTYQTDETTGEVWAHNPNLETVEIWNFEVVA